MSIEDKKKALENKLREIEKRKNKENNVVDKTKSIHSKKELISLKEELKKLKSKKNLEQNINLIKEVEEKTKPVLKVEPEKNVEIEKKPIQIEVKKISKDYKTAIDKNDDFKQRVQKNTNDDTSKSAKFDEKTPIKTLKKTKSQQPTTKQTNNTKGLNSEKKVQKKSVVIKEKDVSNTSKILIYISIVFALVILGYLIKLKIDLDKERELIELQEKEKIDYSKKDAIFKEVEEDEKPTELQEIK